MSSKTTSDISFKGNNPGAVKCGNFINYYQFHSVEDRVQMLPANIWNREKSKYVCLDVGCNAGDLTVALCRHLKRNVCPAVSMLAIDIDETLISRAKEKNEDVSFQCLDIMNESQRNSIHTYLVNCDEKAFDVIFCFSTTMWIHLNHGDEGLLAFLGYMCENSELIVIEAQPWKCYRSAVKRLKLANDEFCNFKKLQIKANVENVIEKFIVCQNFEKIYESPINDWGRKILFFSKKKQF